MAAKHAIDSSQRLSRADLILACMPLLFVGGYAVGVAVFNAWTAATGLAAVAGSLPMVDGLFRNPPQVE